MIKSLLALKLAISILLSSCFLICGCQAFFFHNEPNTNMVTSPAFSIGGRNYFLLKCKIYRKPKGIARFPDGGTSKTVFESVYLMALKDSSPEKIADIGAVKGSSDVYFKSSKIRGIKGGLLIKVGCYDSKAFEKKDMYFFFDAKTMKVSAIENQGGDWPEKSLTIGKTRGFFKNFFDFDAKGLANPLNFIAGSKKPENLAKIILKSNGDRYLRLVAAKKLIDSGNKKLLKKVITGFDKYTNSSNDYWRNEEKTLLKKMIKNQDKQRRIQ